MGFVDEEGVGAYLVGFTRSFVVVATAKSSREKDQ